MTKLLDALQGAVTALEPVAAHPLCPDDADTVGYDDDRYLVRGPVIRDARRALANLRAVIAEIEAAGGEEPVVRSLAASIADVVDTNDGLAHRVYDKAKAVLKEALAARPDSPAPSPPPAEDDEDEGFVVTGDGHGPTQAEADRMPGDEGADGLPADHYFVDDLDGGRIAANPEAPPAPEAREPYEVSDSDTACAHCGAGQRWDVIGPDGVAVGISFADEAEAHETAGMLNHAFAKGRASAPPAPASGTKPDGRMSLEDRLRALAGNHIDHTGKAHPGWTNAVDLMLEAADALKLPASGTATAETILKVRRRTCWRSTRSCRPSALAGHT